MLPRLGRAEPRSGLSFLIPERRYTGATPERRTKAAPHLSPGRLGKAAAVCEVVGEHRGMITAPNPQLDD